MDALIAIGCIAAIWIAFLKVGLWRWVWASIGGVVAAWELYAYLATGQTISQQFGQFAAAHPVHGFLLCLLVFIGGAGLAIHLWVMRKKYVKK